MKNRAIRFLAIILILATFLSFGAIAAYVPPESPDSSSYISSYLVRILNGGNGELKVDFNVTGTGTMTKIGATCIRIYKSNGTYVATIWNTDSGRSGMLGSNTSYHSDVESYTVAPGSYYAKISIFARNSSGSDEIVVTTSNKTIT